MSISFSEDTSEEIITTTVSLPEDYNEGSLRPRTIAEYIGQEKAKSNLEIFINAAKMRKEPLDHVLLHGPPGLGKTTLAAVIANEMGVNMRITSGPAIEKPGDLREGAVRQFSALGSAAFHIDRCDNPIRTVDRAFARSLRRGASPGTLYSGRVDADCCALGRHSWSRD